MGWFKKTSSREESTPPTETRIEPSISKRSTYLGKNLNITGSIVADRDVVDPLIMEDSKAFAAENNIAERCN